MARGYSTRHLKTYAQTGVAAKHFQHRERNQLWQADIKYGPFFLIGEKQKEQIYRVTFIDDALRYKVHAAFYELFYQSILENSFRTAIAPHGAPDRVYFDNGKQFRT